jgi:hypothetical protein
VLGEEPCRRAASNKTYIYTLNRSTPYVSQVVPNAPGLFTNGSFAVSVVGDAYTTRTVTVVLDIATSPSLSTAIEQIKLTTTVSKQQTKTTTLNSSQWTLAMGLYNSLYYLVYEVDTDFPETGGDTGWLVTDSWDWVQIQ